MHTDGDELSPTVSGFPEEAVFTGSGLAAARRPGMTLQLWSVSGCRPTPRSSSFCSAMVCSGAALG